MSAKNSTVKGSSAAIALVVMLCLATLAYCYYLMESNKALDYQASALEPVWYMLKPLVITRLIAAGGFGGTLTAVLMNTLHSMIAAAAAYSVITLAFANMAAPRVAAKTALAKPNEVQGEMPCEIPGSKMVVIVPPNVDAKSQKKIEGIYDDDPYNQVFFRIDKQPLSLSREPRDAIEALQVSVLEMFAAHDTLPASITDHHSEASLKDHSIAVSKLMLAVMERMEWHDPLTRLVGLAHDLDKMLAYTKSSSGAWVKTKDATHHNTYSAYILQYQPGFADLSPEDQRTLVLTLRYYHHPKDLPMHSGERVGRLIQAIREADGLVIQSEQSNGIAAAEGSESTIGILKNALTKFIADCDVNQHKGGRQAAGWTLEGLEFVAIPASTILEGLPAFLPPQLTKQLQLTIDTRRYRHPALPVIMTSLNQMGLLLSAHKAITSATQLFDVRVGVMTFSACMLLDKTEIQSLLPNTTKNWGNAKLGLRVQRETLDASAQETPDDE